MAPEPSPSKDIPDTQIAPERSAPLNTTFNLSSHDSLGRRPIHQVSTEPPLVLISIGAIHHNAKMLREEIGNSRLFVDVSCDAYGHGIGAVSSSVFPPKVEGGPPLIDGFFAKDESGYAMLNNRTLPLHFHISLAANSFSKDDRRCRVAEFAVKNWPVTAGSKNHLRSFQRDASELGMPVSIRLELDAQVAASTSVAAFRDLMLPFPNLRLAVLALRPLRNPANIDLLANGLERLSKVVKEYNQHRADPASHLSLEIPRAHEAFRNAYSKHAIVCSGPEIYGIVEDRSRIDGTDLQPAMRVLSSIAGVQYLEKGQRWHSSNRQIRKFTAVALVRVGFEHGYSKRSGHNLSISIGGKNCSVFGTPRSNYIGADVTDVPEAQSGDQAIVLSDNRFGRSGPLVLAERRRAKWSLLTQGLGQAAGDRRQLVKNFDDVDQALTTHWESNREPKTEPL